MSGDYRGGLSLWNEEDGFFYDTLHMPDGSMIPLKVRSLVGLMPLLAVETLEHDLVESLPVFKRRMNWFFENRIYLRDRGNMACIKSRGEKSRRLLSIINRERLVKVLLTVSGRFTVEIDSSRMTPTFGTTFCSTNTFTATTQEDNGVDNGPNLYS